MMRNPHLGVPNFRNMNFSLSFMPFRLVNYPPLLAQQEVTPRRHRILFKAPSLFLQGPSLAKENISSSPHRRALISPFITTGTFPLSFTKVSLPPAPSPPNIFSFLRCCWWKSMRFYTISAAPLGSRLPSFFFGVTLR